jgi:hypothetical protein
MSMKNYSDIENRTRDLAACSVVPQTTVPPRPRLSAGRKVRGELFVVFFLSLASCTSPARCRGLLLHLITLQGVHRHTHIW